MGTLHHKDTVMAGWFREQFVKRLGRASGWRKVRKEHLKRHPQCENCGKWQKRGMQVHHIKPVGLYPALELDPKNLITLCGNPRCHLDKGHLGNWRSYNEAVIMDTKIWSDKYRNRP